MKKVFTVVVYLFAVIGLVTVIVYMAVHFKLTRAESTIDLPKEEVTISTLNSNDWSKSEEWNVLKNAILKDTEIINRSAAKAGIPPRFIVATLVPEQIRLFHSNRDLFKKVFEPLLMLANQNQFSLGVMGVKPETAIEVEAHLKDATSPFYLGAEYEHVLDFGTDNVGQERLDRLTNEKDRYYSYLYAGLILRQLASQWQKSGFDISDRSDILSTLYNVGFKNSKPHSNPYSGGAIIEAKGKPYSFGGLAGEFYDSDELLNEFSRVEPKVSNGGAI